MPKKYVVQLINEERVQLEQIISKGQCGVRQIRRAHTLLLSDAGKTDEAIADLLHITTVTVAQTRKRWCTERLNRNLTDQTKRARKRKLDGKQEAFLVALACTDAPQGREHWPLRMLSDKLLELGVIDEPVSYETVRDRLQKTNSSPGSSSNGVFQASGPISCGAWKMFWIYMLSHSRRGCQLFALMNGPVNSTRIHAKPCP
jgi:transposase